MLSDYGNGLSGWVSIDFMFNFLFVVISIIWLNNLWFVFRIVFLWVFLVIFGLFMFEKVFNFCLGSGLWKGFFLSLIFLF